MTPWERKSQRDVAVDVGFPMFGLADAELHRSVGGHGWGGSERRFVLRHTRGATKVDVETIVGRAHPSKDFLAHTAAMKWASGRHPFPEALTVELRVGPVEVALDGGPVTLWCFGDDEVWFAAGQVGERHLEVSATGLPLIDLGLVTLTSLDDYEFPDERTQ